MNFQFDTYLIFNTSSFLLLRANPCKFALENTFRLLVKWLSLFPGLCPLLRLAKRLRFLALPGGGLENHTVQVD